MSIVRILSALTGILFVVVAHAAAPGLEFGAGPPKIHGLAPGTKVAWMTMVRERVRGRSHMTVLRGVEPVTPNGDLAVDRPDRDFSRSIWLLSELDSNTVVQAGAPQYPPMLKLDHVAELRTAVNALRIAAGLTAATFTDGLQARVTVRAIHFTELRSALNAARSQFGFAAVIFEPALTAGTPIRAAHVNQLRGGLQ